jgi:hypothetical protein
VLDTPVAVIATNVFPRAVALSPSSPGFQRDRCDAFAYVNGSSPERTAAHDGWLWTYNHRRAHGSLSHKPPIAHLNELNNLAGFYI